MGRQVIKAAHLAPSPGGEGPASEGDDNYAQRLFKLIPAETVAVYLFLQGVLASSLAGEPGVFQTWLWGIFFILLIGNTLYLWRIQNVVDVPQHVILALAFVVWIFSLGGPFSSLSFYQPFMGSVLLGLFTFFMPIVYRGTPELDVT